jgi:subtilase family serine protease
MFQTRWRLAIFSSAVLLIGSFAALLSQTALSQTTSRALISEKVDENKLVTLAGNTRPEASAANDAGAVPDNFPVEHMLLQLKRSPQQEQAVEKLIAALHDPQSPSFHKWLTAREFGERYGLAESDLRTITGWLKSYGFTVNSIYPSGMVIDFSGNAGQVQRAFHTSIHNLNVNGVHHIANFSDPQIPQALAPAVAGVISMHDFQPHKMSRAKPVPAGVSRAQYTYTYSGTTYEAVVPADLATIYDFNPLFTKGITGSGQTIAVLEDTDLYTSADWTTFRKTFGLSQYTSGSLTTVHPGSCGDPGVNADDSEAILDTEWATAAAPGAAIVVASCPDFGVSSGVITAGQNLVNGTAPPAIISVSYGVCEAENGTSSNASLNTLYQQAVAEGISVFVAAGDEGAASCDAGESSASHGIGVSAYASTPYNVAVGGTDYSDVYSGTTGTYWSKTNTATYGSALSYIPEIPWNDSCAGSLLASYMGYSTTYGSNGFCDSATAQTDQYLVVAGGSGGPSNCATGAPAIYGIAGGACAGYAKPSWQTGLSGIPADGVRDIPDVSMFASDGAAWGHYSVVCFSDPNNGGAPCTGAPLNWAGFGGTSVASPVMAGVQALVNQNAGGAQGNPNYVYYKLAASVPSAFHSITQGDIDVNCDGALNCYGFLGNPDYGRGGRVFGTTWGGALSVSDSSFTPAYSATAGQVWNLANGIGSVDAYNLVMNWATGK